MSGIGMFMVISGVAVLVLGCTVGLIVTAIESWRLERDYVPLAMTVVFLWFLTGLCLAALGKP